MNTTNEATSSLAELLLEKNAQLAAFAERYCNGKLHLTRDEYITALRCESRANEIVEGIEMPISVPNPEILEAFNNGLDVLKPRYLLIDLHGIMDQAIEEVEEAEGLDEEAA